MSLIPFAYSMQLKKLVEINEVVSGLSCKCQCPSCSMMLLARKGNVNEHHFSHFDKATNNCNYSYWVSVRDMAKQILESSLHIRMRLNSISALHIPPYLSKTSRIEFFHIHKVQESDYVAITSIGTIQIYFSTPEHRKFSQIKRKGSFTDKLILNIDLSSYRDSKKSALELLIVNDIKCKTFLMPLHRLREQEKLHTGELEAVSKPTPTPIKLKQSDEDEILQKLYLDRRNIQSGTLKIIREMKRFYEESVFNSINLKASSDFEIIYSNGSIDYISYRESFFASVKLGIYNIIYLYHDGEFIKVANTTNFKNIYYAMDKYLNELNEADLVF